MHRDELEILVRDILHQLGSGDVRAVFRQFEHPHDMSVEFFEELVQRMGVTLVPPLAGADLKIDAIRNKAVQHEAWNVGVPIWTKEHGQS